MSGDRHPGPGDPVYDAGVLAERERIRQLAIKHQARYRACSPEDHKNTNQGDCKAWHHRAPFADLLSENEGGSE